MNLLPLTVLLLVSALTVSLLGYAAPALVLLALAFGSELFGERLR